jgi:hypothetical protein
MIVALTNTNPLLHMQMPAGTKSFRQASSKGLTLENDSFEEEVTASKE